MRLYRRNAPDVKLAIENARRKVSALGLQMEGIEPIVHEAKRSFLIAVRDYRNEAYPAQILPSVAVVDKLMPTAFVSELSGDMHVQNSSPENTIAHEFVHAHDYRSKFFESFFNDINEGRLLYNCLGIVGKLKFSMKELLFDAFLEGRAVLCELGIAKTFKERFAAFKKASFIMTGALVACICGISLVYNDSIREVIEDSKKFYDAGELTNHINAILLQSGVYLSVAFFYISNIGAAIRMQLPYFIGYRFMRKVEKSVGSLPETLKLTEQNPPVSLTEMLFPSRYLKRVKETSIEANPA